MVICVVNSEFAVARRDMYLNALLWSLSSPRDTFFKDRSDPEGRRSDPEGREIQLIETNSQCLGLLILL